MALTGTAYLTAAEFQDHMMGMDLAGISDTELLDYIRQASRQADNFIHGSFDVITMDEQRQWLESRRFYPSSMPVHAARRMRIHIGGGAYADIGPADMFPANNLGYVEVVSLAMAIGLSAEMVSFGLSTIVAQLTYKTGGGFRSNSPSGVAYVANTTLAADVDSTETTITVASATGLAVNDVIKVNAESMWIDEIVDTTLAVTRVVQMNDVADAHTSGAAVALLTLALDEEVQLAVAMIAGSYIAARRQNEEGATGVRSFMIGSYSVTYGAKSQGGSGSGYPFIPDIAQDMLEPYRNVTLR